MRDLLACGRGLLALRGASVAALVVWLAACGDPTTVVTGDPDAVAGATDVSVQTPDVDVVDVPEVAALEVDGGGAGRNRRGCA